MSQNKSFKRRGVKLIIDKNFQLRFAIKLALINGALLFTFTGFVLFFVKSNYDMLVREALIQMPGSAEVLIQEFRFLLLTISTGLVILIPVLFAIGLYLSKSIAGPIQALKRRLGDIARGRQGVRLRLRNDDELKSIEVEFNMAISRLESESIKKAPDTNV